MRGPEAMSEYPRFTSVSADTKGPDRTYLVFYYKKSAGAAVQGPRRCQIQFNSKEEALQMANIERAWAEVKPKSRGKRKANASSAQATPRAMRSRAAAKISELETPKQPNNDHLPARADGRIHGNRLISIASTSATWGRASSMCQHSSPVNQRCRGSLRC